MSLLNMITRRTRGRTSLVDLFAPGASEGDVLTCDADGHVGPAAGGGGGSLPSPEWTVSPDGSVVVANYIDDPNNPTIYFSLTATTREVFAGVMRVYNSLTLDDAPMVAKNDNGDPFFELDPAADSGDGEVLVGGVPLVVPDLSGYQQTSEKGQVDGYAALGSDGLVPTAQLPETPAVVPDDAFFRSAGGPPVLTQGNVTASLSQYDVFWQRTGRVVFVRLFVLVDTATGELGEPWFIDLPAGVPSAEYQLGSSAPIAIGSGAFNRDGAWEPVSYQINQDPDGPGPTRRLQLVGPGAVVGTLGAGDQLIGGETIQALLTYEAAFGATEPENVTHPAVTGTAQDGQTLTTDNGTWTGTPTLSYIWEVADDPNAIWTPVVGETSTTLLIVTDQIGKYLRTTVTATNADRSASSTSNYVGPVIAA